MAWMDDLDLGSCRHFMFVGSVSCGWYWIRIVRQCPWEWAGNEWSSGYFYDFAGSSLLSLSLETSITGIVARFSSAGVVGSVDSCGSFGSAVSVSFGGCASSDESSPVGEDGSLPSFGGGGGVAGLCVFSLSTTLSSELAGLPCKGLFMTTASREYGAGDAESESSWLTLLRSDREVREFPKE